MTEASESLNFIEQIIAEDLAKGFSSDNLRFRFPPEPNGYLHIGHAASICLNFGLGQRYNAPVNLRFDDTNPSKEEQEYVDAIKRDIAWMGFQWATECYASDYFQQLYDWAVMLIKKGKAYVDGQSAEAMAEQKGTPTTPGVASPHRDQSVEVNLDLLILDIDGRTHSIFLYARKWCRTEGRLICLARSSWVNCHQYGLKNTFLCLMVLIFPSHLMRSFLIPG